MHVVGYKCVLKVRFNQFLLMITRVKKQIILHGSTSVKLNDVATC